MGGPTRCSGLSTLTTSLVPPKNFQLRPAQKAGPLSLRDGLTGLLSDGLRWKFFIKNIHIFAMMWLRILRKKLGDFFSP